MLYACFYTICLVFRYTSWHFYAFSGTNLLTRCHSASSFFSAVFVFQKSYTGNILGIGRNQSQTSRYFTELPEDRRGDGEGPQGAHNTGRRGLGLACNTRISRNSKCSLCIPPQSQNHCCDTHNVVGNQFHRHYNTNRSNTNGHSDQVHITTQYSSGNSVFGSMPSPYRQWQLRR
jgi:hypothetical protein